MSGGILYISYDGMLEPLGQSQVLAYLEKLALGRSMHLISFEKPNDWEDRDRRKAVTQRIAGAGIIWHPMRYHKSPSFPATAYDIAAGTVRAVAIAKANRIGIVHARSYVAGVMALAVKRMTGARVLFDIRGLWADERVEGGVWPGGSALYRGAKAVERRLFAAADHIVTLTHASEAELRRLAGNATNVPPISIIPTCVDLDRFTIEGPPQQQPFVLGHVGSVGGWTLLDEMLRCFISIKDALPGARMLFVNRGEQSFIREAANALNVQPSVIEIVAAEHADLPPFIRRMSAGIAFYKPSYSAIGRAPTKLAEYLGCGVPCLGTAGIGDMDNVLEGRRVGVVLRDFSGPGLAEGLRRLVGLTLEATIQQRCRDVATELFSLDQGVARYSAIYSKLETDMRDGARR